jgi:hypothetical protein
MNCRFVASGGASPSSEPHGHGWRFQATDYPFVHAIHTVKTAADWFLPVSTAVAG